MRLPLPCSTLPVVSAFSITDAKGWLCCANNALTQFPCLAYCCSREPVIAAGYSGQPLHCSLAACPP